MRIQLKIFKVESWMICLDPTITIRVDELTHDTLIKHTIESKFLITDNFEIGKRDSLIVSERLKVEQWKHIKKHKFDDY